VSLSFAFNKRRKEGRKGGRRREGRHTWWEVSCSARTPFSRRPSTWSWMRERRGEKTMVTPGRREGGREGWMDG